MEQLTKKQRNKLKKDIIKELTKDDGEYNSLFDKKDGEPRYNGINLEMVMECVFKGLNKNTDKTIELIKSEQYINEEGYYVIESKMTSKQAKDFFGDL